MTSRRRSKRSSPRTPDADERGQRAIRFIEDCCVHTIGRWAGDPFILAPWQRDFIYEVFSNCDENGFRITRRAFLAIARKQGKSELAAAVGLYLLLADGEPSPQIYGAAEDRDQASLVFDVAAQMVERSPQLRGMAKVIKSTKRIVCTKGPSEGGYYRAIPADAAGSHGFNASGIIFDEFHTQKNRDLYDVLSTSTSARDQPLIFMITTAGFDKTGPCFEVYQYAKSVIGGTIEDATFVGRVFEAPPGTTFETVSEQAPDGAFLRETDLWPAANPSLLGQPGGFVRPDEIRRAVTEAIHLPRARNHVLNLHFNVWTDAAEAWLDLAAWDRCGGLLKEHELDGRDFYGGLDLSHTQDFSAWCKLFPPVDEDEPWRAVWNLWLPEQALLHSRAEMAPTLNEWHDEGWLEFCDGDLVDHRMIGEQIRRDCERYHLKELGYDRFHAYPLISELIEELGEDMMCDAGQTFRHMNAACKELERMVIDRRVNHGGNPVVRWMASNVVAEVNQDDLIRPSRRKSASKIDGVVALLMAIQRYLANEDEGDFFMYVAGEETGT
jgi:phage terminase large subunit-like protein